MSQITTPQRQLFQPVTRITKPKTRVATSRANSFKITAFLDPHTSQPHQDVNSTAPSTATRRQMLATSLTSAAALLLFSGATPLPSLAAAGAPRSLTPEERDAVDKAFSTTIPKAKCPVMLRLVFHDAGTFDAAANNGGANASIQFELDRPESFGLKRGLNVIDATMAKLAGTPAQNLSKADLIALAGAYAVKLTGGPNIDVPVGRIDATVADPENRLPEETLVAKEQLKMFAAKTITAQEMVAVLGSHTLGNKGFGDPTTFDNEYYRSLLRKPWEDKTNKMADMIGLASDHVIADDPTCKPFIQRYADDEAAFRTDFAAAYIKMTTLGAKWA